MSFLECYKRIGNVSEVLIYSETFWHIQSIQFDWLIKMDEMILFSVNFADENLDIDSHIWFVNFVSFIFISSQLSSIAAMKIQKFLNFVIKVKSRSIDWWFFVHFFLIWETKQTMVQLWCPCCCFQLNHHSLIKINECISLLYQTFWWFNLASWSSSSLGKTKNIFFNTKKKNERKFLIWNRIW